MSRRKDRINKVVRYLTGHTGIPGLSWTGPQSLLTAPFPYSFDMSTEHSLWRVAQKVRATADRRGIPCVIRFDMDTPNVPDAWVVLRLETYCELLALHYKTNSEGRGE